MMTRRKGKSGRPPTSAGHTPCDPWVPRTHASRAARPLGRAPRAGWWRPQGLCGQRCGRDACGRPTPRLTDAGRVAAGDTTGSGPPADEPGVFCGSQLLGSVRLQSGGGEADRVSIERAACRAEQTLWWGVSRRCLGHRFSCWKIRRLAIAVGCTGLERRLLAALRKPRCARVRMTDVAGLEALWNVRHVGRRKASPTQSAGGALAKVWWFHP